MVSSNVSSPSPIRTEPGTTRSRAWDMQVLSMGTSIDGTTIGKQAVHANWGHEHVITLQKSLPGLGSNAEGLWNRLV